MQEGIIAHVEGFFLCVCLTVCVFVYLKFNIHVHLCLYSESPQMQHISFLQTYPEDIFVTSAFNEYVYVLLNYRDFIFLCVGVHMPSPVCVCACASAHMHLHTYRHP